VIDDTVGFTAFHMLFLGGVYTDNVIFIVYFQHVSLFPLISTHIAIVALSGQ